MQYPLVTIKEGRSTSVRFRHPWLFSGGLERADAPHGSVVRVADHDGVVLGTGTFSASSSIAVRMWHYGPDEIVLDRAWFREKFLSLAALRVVMGYGPGLATTGYRLAMSEADGVPGVIVDRYGDVFVMQLSTAGADALREAIVGGLVDAFSPVAVVERSDVAVRKEEGLADVVEVRHGNVADLVEFTEHGVTFFADVMNGQKTGFFCDQKNLRREITAHAKDKTVLNLFSYTGSASIAAMKGGARSVHNVDSSDAALAGAVVHREHHGIAEDVFTTEAIDVFQYLTNVGDRRFGMVVLDPPALIKAERHVEEGKKAYHFLNRACMRLVEDGGIFVTSSCSHFLNEEDLSFILRRASVQANVQLTVLAVVRQSPDHPLSVYFPESQYLKSFVCHVKHL